MRSIDAIPGPDSDLVVYLHIPKTAGSTVRTVFLNSYPRDAIANSGNAFRSPGSSTQKIRSRLDQSGSEQVRILVGNTPYGIFRATVPVRARYMTMLRDPVDQMLSYYHYLSFSGRSGSQILPTRDGPRKLPLPPKESLAEMLASGTYLLDNLATRMLRDSEEPFHPVTEDDLEQAKANLATFSLVGLTERLDESIVLLQRELGTGVVPYASKKVNRERPPLAEVPREDAALLAEYNRFDLELYGFATRLFEERLAEAGPGFEHDVDELRRRSVGRDAVEASLGSDRGQAGQSEPRKAPAGMEDGAASLVLLIHVPQTSGPVFGSILRRGFTKKAVRNAGNVFRGADETFMRVQKLAGDGSDGLRAVMGVVPYGLLHDSFPPSSRYVTLLRDPVERTLSHHRNVIADERTAHDYFATREGARYLPPPPADMSVEEMLDRGVYLLDNVATRMLCGSESPFGELPPDALSRAKENLASFALVGLAERLEESVALLERKLGFPLLAWNPDAEVSPPWTAPIPEGTRAVLEEHNRLDSELYRFAVALFEEAVQSYEGDLAADCAVIRDLLAGGKAQVAEIDPNSSVSETTNPASARYRKAITRRRAWKLLQPSRQRYGPLSVFVHIPKTAGSTFVQILHNNFAVGSVQALGNVFKGSGGIDPQPLEALKATPEELTRYLYVLGGHIPLGVREFLPGDTRFLTFLRDPVERTLSHFYFMRTGTWEPEPDELPKLDPDVSIAEVIADGRYLIDNIQTRMLSGDVAPFGEVTPSMLERAKHNLTAGIVQFGLAERFDESIVLLGKEFEFRSLLYDSLRVNADRPRASQIPAEDKRLAEELNPYDSELYAWAAEVFDWKIGQQDADFELSVAALRTAVADIDTPPPPAFEELDRAELWRTLLHLRAQALEKELELAKMRVEVHAAVVEAEDAEETEAKIAELKKKVSELGAKLEATRARLPADAR